MAERSSKIPVLALLAVVFTLSLTFATLELPRILNRLLIPLFPDIYWEPESIEALMRYARPIGYASLAVIIALIVLGFAKEKNTLSYLGSFAFFIPAFGYFAASMFFLAGIGILRIMWLPFWDSNPAFLKLGDAAYIPYWILVYPLRFLLDPRTAHRAGGLIASLAVGAGLAVFFAGTLTWFYGRLEGRKVFDFWIYKHSRHPQYLGYVLWSYGVMVHTKLSPVPFGGYQPEPSLPWLISALLVVCVSLSEEVSMLRLEDEAYATYRRNTPFMLPLPRFLSRPLAAPGRALLKKGFPENGREILYIFSVYCVIFILISALILGAGWIQAV
ncbi:MAG: hypothetical protein JSV18_03515 [Candidatus Bathyarchaeota archaeon]|nr:MAG: hypothetical protein JSV18_03515 [Candidatus Bathyarchaeota archaeon]